MSRYPPCGAALGRLQLEERRAAAVAVERRGGGAAQRREDEGVAAAHGQREERQQAAAIKIGAAARGSAVSVARPRRVSRPRAPPRRPVTHAHTPTGLMFGHPEGCLGGSAFG